MDGQSFSDKVSLSGAGYLEPHFSCQAAAWGYGLLFSYGGKFMRRRGSGRAELASMLLASGFPSGDNQNMSFYLRTACLPVDGSGCGLFQG